LAVRAGDALAVGLDPQAAEKRAKAHNTANPTDLTRTAAL
jgi:hypothetical protein